MSGRVFVLGSINIDLVVAAPRLPAPGETVLGGHLERHPGGKGANQAVAAARAGAAVVMLGAVGDDAEGRLGLEALAADRVNVERVAHVAGPSGVALITVAPGGENQIVVAPGANGLVTADLVERAFAALKAAPPDVLLASLEVPMAAVTAAAVAAGVRGMVTVVNPAPAARLPDEILRAGPILTPNRVELEVLEAAPDPGAAARRLLHSGAAAVIVTLGEAGAALFDARGRMDVPAAAVGRVIDSTGAGDTFSGVLAAELAHGRSVREACASANVAAALSVRRAGARDGMPTRAEIEDALARYQHRHPGG